MSKQQLVNLAMAHLGEPPFADITIDPQTPALAKVLAQLDGPGGAERVAVSRHPWLCCLTYASLAPMAPAVTNWKWANAFLLPGTAAKVWEVDGEDVAYEIGTELVSGAARLVIRANEAALDVAYTETKPYEGYSDDLRDFMALLLASRTAGPLKSDYVLADALAKRADAALLMAMTGEAGQHGGEDPRFAGGLAEARLGV